MIFLSTPSARRATAECPRVFRSCRNFYPRPPRGGRHRSAAGTMWSRWNFYPRPPRGGRPLPALPIGLTYEISIHALREEGDAFSLAFILQIQQYFYPRPPRGGRLKSVASTVPVVVFLSTPSARRATAKTETKSLFSNKLYNILHEFRRALIYNGSKNYPNHAK